MADVQNIAAKVDEMKSKLFEELDKLKSTDETTQIPGNQTYSAVPQSQGLNHHAKTPPIVVFEATVTSLFNAMQGEIKKLAVVVAELQRDSENYNKARNLNSLVLYGLPEGEDGENLYKRITEILSNKIKVNIGINDVDYCMRLGKKERNVNNKIRPVEIRFVHRWKRNAIYANKKLLKGSKLVIAELLSTEKLKLFIWTQGKVGRRCCWTWQGNVFALVKNSRLLIDSEHVLNAAIRNGSED